MHLIFDDVNVRFKSDFREGWSVRLVFQQGFSHTHTNFKENTHAQTLKKANQPPGYSLSQMACNHKTISSSTVKTFSRYIQCRLQEYSGECVQWSALKQTGCIWTTAATCGNLLTTFPKSLVWPYHLCPLLTSLPPVLVDAFFAS